MYNNYYNKKNSFSGNAWNKRDDFKLMQDVDRQKAYTDTFNEYKNTANEVMKEQAMGYKAPKISSSYGVMGTSVPSYGDNSWTGGANNKNFYDEFGSVYGYNGNYTNNDTYNKWKNYGTVGSSGNVFGDDYKFSDYTEANVKAEYEQTKANWENEFNMYKQAYEDYKKTLENASAERQKAYIRKQYDLKNAMEQSTALGRGGLGTTESGYNRINNNYMNAYNSVSENANETIEDVLNDYKNAYSQIQTQNRLLEEQAKGKQTNYFVDYLKRYLDGDDMNSGQIGANLGRDLTYGEGDNQKTVNEYLTKDKEDELLEYIKEYKNLENRGYFLNNKDFEDISNGYMDTIKGYGSENEAYNDYLKYANELKMKEVVKNPVNYKQRGAIANVVNNISSIGANEKLVSYNGHQYYCATTGYNLQKELEKNYNNAIDGDIVEANHSNYVKIGQYWFSMNSKW